MKKQNPDNRLRNKSILLIAVGLFFLGLLLMNLRFFVLADFFFLAMTLISLKRLELKDFLIVLSPVFAYPVLYLVLAFLGSDILYTIFPVILSLAYAYVFGRMFVAKMDLKLRWVSYGLVLLMLGASFFSDSVTHRCWDVSRAEKGVSIGEIESCRRVKQYHPTTSDEFSAAPDYIRSVVLAPPTIILLGMLGIYIVEKSRRTKQNKT